MMMKHVAFQANSAPWIRTTKRQFRFAGNPIEQAGLTLRPMVNADVNTAADHMIAIERELGTRIHPIFKYFLRHSIAKVLAQPDTYGITLWDKDNQLTGTALLQPDEQQNGNLSGNFLKKQYRRQGIGTRLIQLREEQARVLGLKKLRVKTHHPRVAQLFQQLGFQSVPPPEIPRWCSTLIALIYKPADSPMVYLEKPLGIPLTNKPEQAPCLNPLSFPAFIKNQKIRVDGSNCELSG